LLDAQEGAAGAPDPSTVRLAAGVWFPESAYLHEQVHWSFSFCGLQHNENAVGPGAQTERQGDAGPVRDLLGGKAAPAANHYTTD
jgi:hypothetical protein